MKFKNKKEEFVYCVDKGVYLKEKGYIEEANYYLLRASKIKEEIEKEEKNKESD